MKLLIHSSVSALCLANPCHAATLVGSLTLPTNVDPFDQQFFSSTTRIASGNEETRGAVEGTMNAMSGHEVGVDTYDGIDLRTFSANTQYNDLNRFGSATAGGLITWDFDLSTYLSGKNVGNNPGDSSFALDVTYAGRRTDAGHDGLFFISYTGDGLTLDTTDITGHSVSGATSGMTNFTLVQNVALYAPVASLAANTAADSLSVDLTSQLATIAAGDGKVRLAYLEREFRGDVIFEGPTGLSETVVVPEASSSLLSGLGVLGLLRRRQAARCMRTLPADPNRRSIPTDPSSTLTSST